MAEVVRSIAGEFRRYKALGDAALDQLDERELNTPGPNDGNSAVIIIWHVGGNLASRFTDFLSSDGEKPWRRRDDEFASRVATRDEILAKWNDGWKAVLSTMDALNDGHLRNTVTIRGQSFEVHDALHRALAHVSYHVGQLVYLAKSIRGESWKCLSIPVGGSDAYNRNPTLQDPAEHASAMPTKKD